MVHSSQRLLVLFCVFVYAAKGLKFAARTYFSKYATLQKPASHSQFPRNHFPRVSSLLQMSSQADIDAGTSTSKTNDQNATSSISKHSRCHFRDVSIVKFQLP